MYTPMIEIPVTDYEILVRESEQLQTIKRFLESQKYTAIIDIMRICGIEEEREDESNESL